MATNVWATTTPFVVNGSRKSNHWSRYWPNSPRLPKEKNRATPPTTGGRTIDNVARARTRPRPGKPTRASSQASGTPKRIEKAVAHSEHSMDSHSAWRTSGSLSTFHVVLHGVRQMSPMNGRAKKAMAMMASTSAGIGRLRRSTRRRRGVLAIGERLRERHVGGAVVTVR